MWQNQIALQSMLEDFRDALVKTVQPTIKIGRKWKVVEATDQAKECLRCELVEIDQSINYRV